MTECKFPIQNIIYSQQRVRMGGFRSPPRISKPSIISKVKVLETRIILKILGAYEGFF